MGAASIRARALSLGAEHLTGLGQETQQHQEMFEDNRVLDRKLIDFDGEWKNFNENYSDIGRTWSPRNPGHQNACVLFAIYAAKFCNCQHQLCHQIPPEILSFKT